MEEQITVQPRNPSAFRTLQAVMRDRGSCTARLWTPSQLRKPFLCANKMFSSSSASCEWRKPCHICWKELLLSSPATVPNLPLEQVVVGSILRLWSQSRHFKKKNYLRESGPLPTNLK